MILVTGPTGSGKTATLYAACKKSGYKGSIGIYELMEMSDDIRGLIVAKASSSAIKASAALKGSKTLRQEGLIRAASGITSVEEVLRVTQEAEEA
jgi:type II secretory ATPase GspE/PulE/Tfp pilus assembly ATPase PilB-like protein